MSKQPKASIDKLRALKHGRAIIGDPRQLWLLVRFDPTDSSPGCFCLHHAANYDKLKDRSGVTIMAHSWDKAALTDAAKRATEVCGPNYQPRIRPWVKPTPEPSQLPTIEDFLEDMDKQLHAARTDKPLEGGTPLVPPDEFH